MKDATLDMIDKGELHAAANRARAAVVDLYAAIEDNDRGVAQTALADLEDALDRARAVLPEETLR